MRESVLLETRQYFDSVLEAQDSNRIFRLERIAHAIFLNALPKRQQNQSADQTALRTRTDILIKERGVLNWIGGNAGVPEPLAIICNASTGEECVRNYSFELLRIVTEFLNTAALRIGTRFDISCKIHLRDDVESVDQMAFDGFVKAFLRMHNAMNPGRNMRDYVRARSRFDRYCTKHGYRTRHDIGISPLLHRILDPNLASRRITGWYANAVRPIMVEYKTQRKQQTGCLQPTRVELPLLASNCG